MYIPDPLELLDNRIENAMDRIQTVDGVDMYPCDSCERLFPIDEMISTDQWGTGMVCGCDDCSSKEIGDALEIAMSEGSK